MKWNDEIVEEVRRVRDEQAQKFNYDIAAICADIRLKQATSNRQIVMADDKSDKEVKDEAAEMQQAA